MNDVAGPRRTLILWALGMTCLISPAWTQVPAQDITPLRPVAELSADARTRGLQIFTEADQRHNQNYQDFDVAVTMELFRRAGAKPVQRRLRIRQLEVDAGDQVMVVFEAPAAIRGTALLTHTHLQGDDDQWLFLPSLKRVVIAGAAPISRHNAMYSSIPISWLS